MAKRLVKEWSFVIHSAGADESVTISTDAAQEGWNDLGRFRFELDAEVELLGQPKDRHDVVVAVRVMVYDALVLEDLDKRLESDVAWRSLLRIAGGPCQLLAILDGFYEPLTH